MISSSPGARLDGVDGLEDERREQVDADEGKVGTGHGRFLDERDHPTILELGDPETLRLRDPRQQDHRVRPGSRELVDECPDPLRDQVVAEVHDKAVASEEVASDAHRMSEPERGLLRDERDAGIELRPVADGGAHLIGCVADDDPDVVDACLGQRIDRVEQDRSVGDRDELFRAGVGDRPKPSPLAATEDEPLHREPGARIPAGYQPIAGSPTRQRSGNDVRSACDQRW